MMAPSKQVYRDSKLRDSAEEVTVWPAKNSAPVGPRNMDRPLAQLVPARKSLLVLSKLLSFVVAGF